MTSIRKVIDAYQKFTDFVYELALIVCRLFYVVMVVMIFYAVIGRTFLQASPAWANEVGVLAMVWICFLTAALSIRDGTHIRMTLIEYVVPKKVAQILHFLVYVTLLWLSILFVIYGWDTIELTMLARMPALQVPMAVTFSSVFVSGVLGIIMTISRLLRGGW